MKKTLSLFVLSLMPALALAAGDHAGGHDMAAMPDAQTSSGQPGDPAKADRSIEVVMDDTMRFTPANIKVKKGETVRFLIKNQGMIPHEMVIGSVADLQAHAAEMLQSPGMAHAEPNALTLDAGQQGQLVWQFGQAGAVDFACLIAGHLEAGMVGKVKVG